MVARNVKGKASDLTSKSDKLQSDVFVPAPLHTQNSAAHEFFITSFLRDSTLQCQQTTLKCCLLDHFLRQLFQNNFNKFSNNISSV